MSSTFPEIIQIGKQGPAGPPGPAGPGPYRNNYEAGWHGVADGQPYRRSDGVVAWRGPVTETKVAFMGDSLTKGLEYLPPGSPTPGTDGSGWWDLLGLGYAEQLRRLYGCTWDFQPNGSTLTFATVGYTTQQVRDTHLPQLLASGAHVCVEMSGINDALGSVAPATTVANWRAMWQAILDAGIGLVIPDITSVGLNWPQNGDRSASNRALALRPLKAALAAEMGIPFAPFDGALDLPGMPGVMDPRFTYDGVHWTNRGAALVAEKVYPVLRSAVTGGIDVRRMAATLISFNNDLAGQTAASAYGAIPYGYGLNVPAGATCAISLQTVGGVKYVKIVGNTEGAIAADNTAMIEYYSADNLLASPASARMDAFVSYDLRSGYLDAYKFGGYTRQDNYATVGQAQCWNHPNPGTPRDQQPILYANAGKRDLRTTQWIAGSSTTQGGTSLSLAGNFEVWIQAKEYGLRKFS